MLEGEVKLKSQEANAARGSLFGDAMSCCMNETATVVSEYAKVALWTAETIYSVLVQRTKTKTWPRVDLPLVGF